MLKILISKTRIFFLSAMFLWLASNAGLSQGNVNLVTGIGLPDLFNVGMYYQFDQTVVGLSYGNFIMGEEDKLQTVSGDIFFHYGGLSDKSPRKKWFIRIGITYLKEETRRTITEYGYLTTRIGREFNFSNRIGLQLGVGLMAEMDKKVTRKVNRGNDAFNFDIDIPVFPSLNITLFFRL